MILARSSADPTATRSRQNGMLGAGLTGWVTTYIGVNRTNRGSMPTPELGVVFPVAHLAEQEAGTSLKPHYHKANQFQIFLTGSGFLGRRPVRGVTVHYTNAGTPYGPIEAGPEGLNYLTLRNSYDPGPRNMPESRPDLQEFPRSPRHIIADPVDPLSLAELAALTSASTIVVQAQEPEGFGAKVYRIPSDLTVTGTDPATGRGQYWIVLGGDLQHGGQTLPLHSCLFVSPDEGAFAAKAGSRGLEVLQLQYPLTPVPGQG